MQNSKNTLPVADDNLCRKCVAICCSYITIEIDKPTNKRMRDDVRWYLLHEGVTLLITNGDWSIKAPTRCSMLGPDNACTIYETRPQACRDYSTENCDYHTIFGDWGTEYIEIETVEEYEAFLDKEKRKRARKKALKKKHSEGKNPTNGKAKKKLAKNK